MNAPLNRGWLSTFATCMLVGAIGSVSAAAMIVSDGSDGAFHPVGSQTINMNAMAPDGVFNFTTIHIPANVTIRFTPNDLNTSAFFAATGNVLIEGTIDISGSNFSRNAGPGGGKGGPGHPNSAAEAGFGPSPGQGGPPPAGQGNGGGGGGMATPGLMATSRTGSNPAPGGNAISRPEMAPGQAGGGGSGGGGGGGRLFHGVNITGSGGGGAAGGLQISTPGAVTISGTLRANGGHAGWAFANVFAHGGPGGGGSGGNMAVYGGAITLTETAVIDARGGAGGGLSTETVAFDPYRFSSGANGGQGYLFVQAGVLAIDDGASIGAALVPEPATLSLIAIGALGVLRRRR